MTSHVMFVYFASAFGGTPSIQLTGRLQGNYLDLEFIYQSGGQKL
jgi:hypothetical protein